MDMVMPGVRDLYSDSISDAPKGRDARDAAVSFLDILLAYRVACVAFTTAL